LPFELAAQGQHGLFAARSRAAPDARSVGQLTVQPGRHARGLFFTARGESPRQILGIARHPGDQVGMLVGFGVPPENQVHAAAFHVAA
jgi:hypothetical protein